MTATHSPTTPLIRKPTNPFPGEIHLLREDARKVKCGMLAVLPARGARTSQAPRRARGCSWLLVGDAASKAFIPAETPGNSFPSWCHPPWRSVLDTSPSSSAVLLRAVSMDFELKKNNGQLLKVYAELSFPLLK